MAFDRSYQPGGSFTPVGVADYETARVQVWVPGHGWAERTEGQLAELALAEAVDSLPVEDECEGAA